MLRIVNGELYDPANGVDGEVRTLAIREGRIVAEAASSTAVPVPSTRAGSSCFPGASTSTPTSPVPRSTRPASSGPRITGRRTPVLRTATTRSGVMGSTPVHLRHRLPLRAASGYTTVFDAAVPPLGARHAHEELHDTPDHRQGLLRADRQQRLTSCAASASGEPEKLARTSSAWLLAARQGLRGRSSSTPAASRCGSRAAATSTALDDPVPRFGVTPRQIVVGLAQAVADLGIPHPVHIHCQQPRRARQLGHDARNDEGARGPPRALRRTSSSTRYGGEPGDRCRSVAGPESSSTTSTRTPTSASTSARWCSATRPR